MKAETTNHRGGALHGTAVADQKTLKVALYARVSTEHQTQSLETQIQLLRAAAEQRDMEVALEVREVVSGAASKLPKRDALLGKAGQADFDAIMVTRLDRYGRSLLDMLNTWIALEGAGVNFISLVEGIDFSTPTGKLLASLLAVIAEFERDLIRNRTREGREAAMSKGVRFGRPKALDDDTEREIAVALEMNEKQMDLAEQYNVSQGTIYRINKRIRHRRETGPKRE